MSGEIQEPKPPEPTDSELVLQAKNGNKAAFEKLIERFNDPISRYLIRMVGDEGIGCDLTQDTFLRAWLSILSLRDPSLFKSWLYRIATNLARDHQQRKRHIPWLPWKDIYREQGEREEMSIAGPEERTEEVELVKLAFDQVTFTYRVCLYLYVVEELPQREIAEHLSIKESCVSKYVSRGKEEFRQNYLRLVNESNTSEKGRHKQ